MKDGDVVQLKSGGPLMTIINVIEGKALCTWFDDKKELKTANFPIVVLETDEEL
ncbi:YodC family protein [Shewanella algae]|uniref:YodC family protein n=1 Tax=Shewanella algae TaxID=38313 RepID=UPI000B8B6A7A|nr:DUF2158 domain-containing protein [Shewanella algae]